MRLDRKVVELRQQADEASKFLAVLQEQMSEFIRLYPIETYMFLKGRTETKITGKVAREINKLIYEATGSYDSYNTYPELMDRLEEIGRTRDSSAADAWIEYMRLTIRAHIPSEQEVKAWVAKQKKDIRKSIYADGFTQYSIEAFLGDGHI